MKFLPAWSRWLLPLVALAALGLYAAWLFLPQGSGVGKVFAALAHPSAAGLSLDQRVVLEVRLPRIITAILVGAVLAVSGLLLQTMTRNPLASPSLLSINAGAGLGIILTGVFLTASAAGDFSLSVTPAGVNATALALAALVLLLGVFFAWNSWRAHERSPVALTIAALCSVAGLVGVLVFTRHAASDFIAADAVQHFLRGTRLSVAAAVGGALSWSLVMFISYSGGRLQQNRLILAGIAVSAFCVALGRAALLLDETQASSVMRWLAGSLNNITWAQLHQFWPWVVLPILPLLWLLPKLNILRLSDDAAQSLGLIGAALALSGTIIQGIIHNPLASPDILGINHGASLAAVLTLTFISNLPLWALPLAACLGAAAAFAILLALTRKNTGPLQMALIGVALSALYAALADYLLLTWPQNLNTAMVWLTGSLWNRSWVFVQIAVPVLTLLLPLALLASKTFDLLTLCDQKAATLGVSVRAQRNLLLALAVILAAIAGPITFLGLVAPHLARKLVGGRHIVLLPAALLTGALILQVSDIAVRSIKPPLELPAGIFTALIGAPYFFYLLRKKY